jgi:hypothetical protein
MFAATTPSSSPLGLIVIPPRLCRNCGADTAIIGSSAGPHHAGLSCCGCGRHRGWLSGEAFRFLSDAIDSFGRPSEPIVIRHNQSAPCGADIPSSNTRHGKGNDMHVDQLYPSRFLRCADLNGKPRRVTIAGLKREDVGGEQKNVLAFSDETLLILNKPTRARSPGCMALKLAAGMAGTSCWCRRRSISAATSSMPSASVA